MERLFCVKNVSGKVMKNDGKVDYFDNKMNAKAYRDQFAGKGASVARGPDHIGKHGVFSKKRQNKV